MLDFNLMLRANTMRSFKTMLRANTIRSAKVRLMHLKRTFQTFALLGLLTLTGCAGFKDESSCTKIDGLSSCASMSDVNNMTDSGYIAADENGHTHRGYGDTQKKSPNGNASNPQFKGRGVISPARLSTTPVRIPERTVKMVVFPYLDSAQNYHDTATIDILLTHSYWSKPAIIAVHKQVQDEDEDEYEGEQNDEYEGDAQ